MRADVLKIFDQFITDTFKAKPEVSRYLMNHERKNLCVDNLCEQIQIIERRRLKIVFDAAYYKRTIQDIARMFCNACLKHAEEKSLSSNERLRRIDEGNREADVKDMLNQWQKDGELRILDRTKELGADNGPSQEEVKGTTII
jgi:hypothetical protein